MLFFSRNTQNGCGLHPASYSRGTGGSFLGVKPPECDVDHSPSPNAEVNEWRCTTTPSVCLCGGYRDKFTSLNAHKYCITTVIMPVLGQWSL